MSSGLKMILSPFVDSRHYTWRSLSATPSRPPLLPSVALAPPFLVLDAIFSSNKISGRATQIFEPRFFCRWVVRVISVGRIFWPKKKSVSTPSVSFIHQWRFPCRRGTRVNISTPFIPVHVTFEYSVTDYTGSTDKERRLSRSTGNP